MDRVKEGQAAEDGPIDCQEAADLAEVLFNDRSKRRRVYAIANRPGSTLPVIRIGNKLMARSPALRRWLREQEQAAGGQKARGE